MMKIIKQTLATIGIITLLFAGYGPVVFAADCVDNSSASIIDAPSSLPRVGCGNDKSYLQTILKLVFGALAMFSLLFVVIGGFKYTISGGDSNAIASAKKTILYAVVGLAIGVSTFTIVSYVFKVIG